MLVAGLRLFIGSTTAAGLADSVWLMIGARVAAGASAAMVTGSITPALPLERQGVASALNDTMRELGSALGVALLGAIFSAVYAARMSDTRTNLPNDAVRTASDGIAQAFDVAGRQADTSQAAALTDAARQAFVGGWAASMWAGAAAMAAVLVGLLWLTPSAELERKTSRLADTDTQRADRPRRQNHH